MAMSGIQWFIIGAVFTFAIGYVLWFCYNYMGLKEIYFSSKKRKEIDLAVRIIQHCGNDEDFKIITLIKYGIKDPVIVRLAEEKLKKINEVKKDGNEIQSGSESRSGQQSGNTAGNSDIAGQRSIQERTPSVVKGTSKYFN